MQFSFDSNYIVAIGCDSFHTLGVFDIISGAKVCSYTAQNGIPPQIKWMMACPSPQYTEYISREHAGLCDVFATSGEHHIKLWTLRRPVSKEKERLRHVLCTAC